MTKAKFAAARKGAKKLSDNEARFVQEYMVDLSQMNAVIRSGNKSKNPRQIGWQLMQRAHVRAAIEAEMKKLADSLQISAKSVLWDIQRVATKAEEDGDLSTALKGRELLGKHLKLFTDKVELTGNVTIQATPADERL